MKLKIITQKWVGYKEDVYSWECPLCMFRVFPDLDQPYVIDTSRSHLRSHHSVENDKIVIVLNKIDKVKNKAEILINLLPQVFEWARAANPQHPWVRAHLTAAYGLGQIAGPPLAA